MQYAISLWYDISYRSSTLYCHKLLKLTLRVDKNMSISHRWLSAKLQYLQCIINGAIAVFRLKFHLTVTTDVINHCKLAVFNIMVAHVLNYDMPAGRHTCYCTWLCAHIWKCIMYQPHQVWCINNFNGLFFCYEKNLYGSLSIFSKLIMIRFCTSCASNAVIQKI